jgi:peptidoglycan/LPS O-acetylase OafA/YrhL
MTASRIPTLDGWRAVAISAVIVSHGFLLGEGASKAERAISYAAEHLGGLGVSLFFSISGYLITTLLLIESQDTGRISLRGFFLRRAFRILPPAFLYLLTLVVLGTPLKTGELSSAAFFYSNYWADRSWYTQHFWSLSVEEHFYLAWPAMLASLGAKRAATGAAALIAATILWRPWSLAHITLPFPALQRTDMRLDAFLFAGLTAIVLHKTRGGGAVQIFAMKFAVKTVSSPWLRPSASALLLGMWAWSTAGSAPATAALAQSALFPLLIVSVIRSPESAIHRILESAPLRWIGRISYGMYLWQQLFFIGHSVDTLSAAVLKFPSRIAAILGIAALSYYRIERPLLSYGRRLSRRISSWPDSAQVSWKNEPNAQNAQGSIGVRAKARGQAN